MAVNESPAYEDEPLILQEHERELLVGELQALVEALPVDRRAPYESLAAAVARGAVPAGEIMALEMALDLILASGRARHVHRAEGERFLEALYDRTPRGQARKAELAQTNRALRTLAGQQIDSVRVNSTASGRHTVTIATDVLQITVLVDRNGVRIDQAGV